MHSLPLKPAMTEYNPSSATTTQEIYDVLICGAGSVGMYLAYQVSSTRW